MHQRIQWLVQSRASAPAEVPAPEASDWLSEAEQRDLNSLVRPKRRQDWLLGRWTAKQLVRSVVGSGPGQPPRLRDLDVRPGDDGAPRIRLYGDPLPISLSISHSGDRSLCALCVLPGARVGADLETVVPRDAAFVEDYFTPAEQAAVSQASDAERDQRVTVIWSAKEAVLKALYLGLTVDTRRVCCVPGPWAASAAGWKELEVTVDPELLDDDGCSIGCWCKAEPGAVMTLAALL